MNKTQCSTFLMLLRYELPCLLKLQNEGDNLTDITQEIEDDVLQKTDVCACEFVGALVPLSFHELGFWMRTCLQSEFVVFEVLGEIRLHFVKV